MAVYVVVFDLVYLCFTIMRLDDEQQDGSCQSSVFEPVVYE